MPSLCSLLCCWNVQLHHKIHPYILFILEPLDSEVSPLNSQISLTVYWETLTLLEKHFDKINFGELQQEALKHLFNGVVLYNACIYS